MRVLFPERLDARVKFGGDSRMIEIYAAELRALGCDVVVSDRLHQDYAAFDVVHFMNINNPFETSLRLRKIRSLRRPPRTVITPFHHKTAWMLPYYRDCLHVDLGKARHQGALRFDAIMTAKDALRYALAARRHPQLLTALPRFRTTARLKRFIVDAVDVLLVHSVEEADSIRADFQSGPTAHQVIPVGREPATEPAGEGRRAPGYVLTVGRIEPLKNQLALIEALAPLGHRLLFVGRLNQRHRGYARRFTEALARHSNVEHVPHLERSQLDAAYRDARLHVIASWYEVFPLTNVEASVHGCPFATTRNSYERDVYGDAVGYVDPESVASIRAVIADLLEGPRPDGARLAALIPPWSSTARSLLAAYHS